MDTLRARGVPLRFHPAGSSWEGIVPPDPIDLEAGIAGVGILIAELEREAEKAGDVQGVSYAALLRRQGDMLLFLMQILRRMGDERARMRRVWLWAAGVTVGAIVACVACGAIGGALGVVVGLTLAGQ